MKLPRQIMFRVPLTRRTEWIADIRTGRFLLCERALHVRIGQAFNAVGCRYAYLGGRISWGRSIA